MTTVAIDTVQATFRPLPLREVLDLFPLRERGKARTPLHKGWQSADYSNFDANAHIEDGYNVGARLKPDQLIIDIDPRHFGDVGDVVMDVLAARLGFGDFGDLLFSDCPIVRTARGGYNIYCQLPDGVTKDQVCQSPIEGLPGVEYKTQYGVLPPSISEHGAYKWESESGNLLSVPMSFIELIKKRAPAANDNHANGNACLTPEQLKELVLDYLNVLDYQAHDDWLRIAMASHNATGGAGLAVFLEWSLGDPGYRNKTEDITTRWQSFDSPNAGARYTYKTLLAELHKFELSTKALQQVVDRACVDAEMDALHLMTDAQGFEDDTHANGGSSNTLHIEAVADIQAIAEDNDRLRDKVLSYAQDIANLIDPRERDGYEVREKLAEGSAIAFVKTLNVDSSRALKVQAIQNMLRVDYDERLQCEDYLNNKKILNAKQIEREYDSLTGVAGLTFSDRVRKKALEQIFDKGRYLARGCHGDLWLYSVNRWISIDKHYLAKIVEPLAIKMTQQAGKTLDQVALGDRVTRGLVQDSSNPQSFESISGNPAPILNLANGEVHINTVTGGHEFKPHCPESYQTHVLPYAYDPDAKCPLFLKTLSEIFEPTGKYLPDVIRHMAEVFGYLIQPIKEEASYWIWHGQGGDGKSTMLRILKGLLGNRYAAESSSLLKISSGADQFAFDRLVGKLVVAMEELPTNYVLSDEGTKMLSETTTRTANPKFMKPFSFTYTAGLIMCCNTLPKLVDNTDGSRRRANVIPFKQRFVTRGIAKKGLANAIIANELPGVLNWALEGYARYKARGGDAGAFDVPRPFAQTTANFFANSNPAMQWATDNLNITNNQQDQLPNRQELYDMYKTWVFDEGSKPLARNNFFKFLALLGLTVTPRGLVFGGKLQSHD